MTIRSKVMGAVSVALICPSLMAFESGDWKAHLGGHYVEPKKHNSDIVGVDAAMALTASLAYFVTPTLAVDLLVAFPFQHDITLNATDKDIGSTQHLPPTLSLMWYPKISTHWQPYLGAGVNYTVFFQERTKGDLDGSTLRLEDSWGPALALGFEVPLADPFSVSVDIRYLDISSEAYLNGESIGKVHIDPVGYGVSLVYRF